MLAIVQYPLPQPVVGAEESKSADFTAVVGGNYKLTASATVTLQDPSELTSGTGFAFNAETGTTTLEVVDPTVHPSNGGQVLEIPEGGSVYVIVQTVFGHNEYFAAVATSPLVPPVPVTPTPRVHQLTLSSQGVISASNPTLLESTSKDGKFYYFGNKSKIISTRVKLQTLDTGGSAFNVNINTVPYLTTALVPGASADTFGPVLVEADQDVAKAIVDSGDRIELAAILDGSSAGDGADVTVVLVLEEVTP